MVSNTASPLFFWRRTDFLFERLAFLQSETVRFGNNRDDIDDLTKFFHHSHVYGAERMASRVDKVQAAVDTRVLDVTVTHRRELLAKVRAVLVLDILHNWVPATTLAAHASIPAPSKRAQEYVAHQFSLFTWSP